jgi:hypothetical protein
MAKIAITVASACAKKSHPKKYFLYYTNYCSKRQDV